MKKILFLLAIAFGLFVSCVSDLKSEQISVPTDRDMEKFHSENEAIDIALALMGCRTGSRTNYNVSNVRIIGNGNSRNAVDTLIYAVNFAENKGFVLVSAAKTGEQILGYSDEGNFDFESSKENDAFSFYMNMAKEYVTAQIDTGKLEPTPNPFAPITTYDIVRPRITLGWGQKYPEGIYCPNKISGCVQTAMALMLAALKQPEIIYYTFPERDQDIEIIDWEDVVKHDRSTYLGFKDSHLENCEACVGSHNTIGRLCREMGYRNKAEYGSGYTRADVGTARETMLNFLLGKCTIGRVTLFEDFTADEIFTELHNRDAVALVGGVDYNTSDWWGAAHAWVLCGGEQITTTRQNPTIGHDDEIITTVKSYLYFNWGHNGSHNGYFPYGVFDQSSSVVPSRGNYSSEVRLFFVSNNRRLEI